MQTDFVLDALEQALYDRQPAAQALTHHSDRGSPYVCIRYTERLGQAGIRPSVGSKGDSYDNALAETINGLYKAELIHHRALEDQGGRGVGHAGMGGLVQPSQAARTHRVHPARRS